MPVDCRTYTTARRASNRGGSSRSIIGGLPSDGGLCRVEKQPCQRRGAARGRARRLRRPPPRATDTRRAHEMRHGQNDTGSAVGRKNWLFVGNDEAAEVNATFVSLLASCQLHGIEPWAYLRDLLCLLPRWPQRRVLDLAPAFWKQTLQEQDTQQRLADNVFRPFSLAPVHPQQN